MAISHDGLGIKTGDILGMKNRITELRKARGLSSRALAKIVGTSPSQMGRIEKNKRGLSIEWLLRISRALDVPPNELVDMDLGTSTPVSCDQALLGTVIGFVFKACESFEVKPSAKDIAGWVSFVYDHAAQHHLTFAQTRELVSTIVKVSKKAAKPNPFDIEDDEEDAPRAAQRRRLKVAGID
ncbi:MAG: helix-turn-helix transcriptional regulator [Bdellovibrionales bacterium]